LRVTGIAALAFSAAGLAPALSLSIWMTDAEIRELFAGKAIDGYYANGKLFAESYGEDGRVDYQEPGQSFSGRWSVTADTLCTIYDGNTSGGCFRVRRASLNCFEFYFAARTEEEAVAPPDAPQWAARGWITDQESTCTEDVNA
jgi:hypothetical protein